MKLVQISLLILLIFCVNCETSDDCSTSFESELKYYCQKTFENSTHICQYSKGKCELNYLGCSNYEGKEPSVCESIIPSNKEKKCKIQGETCTEVQKECGDYEEGITTSCVTLSAGGNNKRCILNNGKCESHYNTCSLLGTNQQSCEANIPSDAANECVWKDGACQEQKKSCEGSSYTSDYQCSLLSASDDDKRCLASTNGGCKEQYKTCELYNEKVTSKTKADCESLRIEEGYGYFRKCVFKDNTCATGTKCSDFTYESGCNNFSPSDTNKRCIFINNVCEEIYKTCELYNTYETNKKQETCQKILPYYENNDNIDKYSKCLFESSQCVRKKKSCSEINEENVCNNQIFDKTLCVYDNNNCKEVFKTCQDYDDNPSSGNKNAADCKATKVYYDNGIINYNYKCVFDETKKTCSQKKLEKCEDYESGQDEKYCSNINLGSTFKGCAIQDKKCVETYINCPNKEENLSKENCEKIELWDYYICKYDQTKGCYRKIRDCSDANDKVACESMVLYNESEDEIDYNNKCVWGNACTKTAKECKDAQNAKECDKITLKSSNKNCIYLNGECKEQYQDCASYNNNGKEKIEQSVCESIVLVEALLGLNNHHCVFKNNQCVEEEKKSCSEFNVDNYESLCLLNSPSSKYTKCVYSNSACSDTKKNCLELSDESEVDKETCESAPTSGTNKYCSLKADESGCEEKEKENNNKATFGLNDKKLWFNLLVILFGLIL